jgi:hypothetical protein
MTWKESDMKLNAFLAAAVLTLLAGCSSLPEDAMAPVAIGASPSAPRAAIQTSLGDGPGIAALINKNYNEDTTSCTSYLTKAPMGYYFCTGVLLRTTNDGAFNPWEASPSALRLQGTSFSWIRHDLNTNTFYKRAGFIVLSPADVIGNAVPGITYPAFSETGNTAVICVYPFDAWTTRTMTRFWSGCDKEGTGLGQSRPIPVGACEAYYNYTTQEQWNNHFNSVGHINYRQCSWNADISAHWRNMIGSHNTYGGQASWNEVMVHNFPGAAAHANDQMRRWTVAFFYDIAKAGSLQDAQSFQRKMSATGKRVPILALNFSAAPSERFKFIAGDQVVGVYP